MTTVPQVSNLLVKLSQKLFLDDLQRDQFIQSLVSPSPFSPAILWLNDRPDPYPFQRENPLSWQPQWVDRLAISEKPGKHFLHEQGYFYCLDFSSVFASSVLQAIAPFPQIILDMCASPGGKGIFAWRLFKPDLLLANEVIGKRRGALISNLKRCRIEGAIAISVDSKIVAQEIPESADLVIVDAPCTGQSLLAKGEKNPGCFHPVTIKKNANRQRRILANSASTVAPKGYLAYMTCAYSIEENEQVCEWFLSQFPEFSPVPIPLLSTYQSRHSRLPCYRMFPQDHLGAGAFTILFQNQKGGDRLPLSQEFLTHPSNVAIKLNSG